MTLSNGSFFFIQDSIIQNEQIFNNDEITYNKLSEIYEKSEIKDAEISALRLLSFSSHSESKLRIKLVKKEFSKKSIDRVIEKLIDYGYLNDTDYAKNWLILRIKNRPESKTHFFYGLLKQGIHRDIADKILKEYITYKVEIDCAERVVKKLIRYKDLSLNELKKKLYSKGFKLNIINEVLKQK